MLDDIRFALRGVRRNPGFATVAIVTLALGIGANTAMFSVADAVLFQPLPYPEPGRIFHIDGAPFRFTKTGMSASRGMERSPAFNGVGMFAVGGLNVGAGSHPERVIAAAVSAGFFQAMGTTPVQGRVFTGAEADANERVAVIGYDLWRRRFGASGSLDQPIVLNGQPFTVVGVMPRRYSFPDAAEIWIPPSADRQITGGAFAPSTVARLAQGITPQQANDEVERIKYANSPRDPRDRDVLIVPLKDQLVGPVRPLFAAVAIAALLVLLVACINTANLMLARMSSRQRELSVRRALGASRARLVRFLLVESAVVAIAAGAAAMPAALITLGALKAALPPTLYGVDAIALDGRAMAVTSALSLLSVLIFGLIPAVIAPTSAAGALRGGTATPGRAWRRFRASLVAVEVAAALVLLAGALTIVRTVADLMRVDLGARAAHVLTLHLTLPIGRYPTVEHEQAFHDRLESQLRAIAGVESVGVTTMMPGSREVATGTRLDVQGETLTAGAPSTVIVARASHGYFDAMGIDLLAGRSFGPMDRAGGAPVAIVSEQVGRAFGLGPSQMIGRHIRSSFGATAPYAEIVGVVRDVRLRGPEGRPVGQLYRPIAQISTGSTHYVAVRTTRDPRRFVADLQATLRAIDPDMPPYNVRTMEEISASYLSERRFAQGVMIAFAVLTAALAAVGLYGVVSYLVLLRTREIGIRMALGASHRQVAGVMLWSGVSAAGAGIAAGTGAAWVLSRVFISQLPGIQAIEPSTLAVTALTMLVLAAGTSWIPAARAARVRPVEALRVE